MTKEEVIQALRACTQKACVDCPLYDRFTCRQALLKEALEQMEDES